MAERTEELPRVLVVDDNQDAATSLAVILRATGYDVETAFDGKTALQAATRFEPDACVLDIDMPEMDGYELARRLRALAPNHLLILATVTGSSDESHLDRAAAAGFDLHFTKPADPREIVEQLRACLRQQPVSFNTATR